MSAAGFNNRRVALGLAAAAFAAVVVALAYFQNPGIGIGHFFYVPICLVALSAGPMWGGAAGTFSAAVYTATLAVMTGLQAPRALAEMTAIRLVTFTVVGALVGWYASSNRALVAKLRDHATHDFLTGVSNARVFDEQLALRCGSGQAFTIVLTDVDDLKRLNDMHGHEAGNAALRTVAVALSECASSGDSISRIGGDEFAILTSRPVEETTLMCARIARTLAADEISLSFGTTSSPADGTTAVELFRKADDRLFAAKLLSRNRRTVVALANG